MIEMYDQGSSDKTALVEASKEFQELLKVNKL